MHSARRLALVLLFLALLSSCARKTEQRYDLTGKVVAVDAKAHELTIQHEDVPGLMKGMTMPFRVKDEWVFNEAAPGDNVTAVLVIRGGSSHLENVVLTKSTGPTTPTGGMHLPQLGDTVPDFTFTNQDAKRLKLSQLRGKAVLLTFIYTRCPLPDYCIRMSNNFSAIARELKKHPALYDRTEQLSISFDPEYDKPKVLREYGERYAGDVDPKFTHWQFVSATPDETKKAAEFFGLSYMPDGTTIVHSLRTAVIGPDGKIAKVLNGNEWKPADAISAIESSLQ
jgi:protein SCO1